jgi:hypothetical protein
LPGAVRRFDRFVHDHGRGEQQRAGANTITVPIAVTPDGEDRRRGAAESPVLFRHLIRFIEGCTRSTMPQIPYHGEVSVLPITSDSAAWQITLFAQ